MEGGGMDVRQRFIEVCVTLEDEELDRLLRLALEVSQDDQSLENSSDRSEACLDKYALP